MRLFEATGLGCTLITDHKNDLHEYFAIDSEIISYSSAEEASEKIDFLMENPSIGRKIGIAGQKKCLEVFNTQNQINNVSELLKTL